MKFVNATDAQYFDSADELEKGLKLHNAGHLREAQEVYQGILAGEVAHSDALRLLGLVHHQLNERDIALNLISKAIRISPENPWYYNDLGLVFKEIGQLDKAVKCYEKALEIAPDQGDIWKNLGNVYSADGQPDEAIACYQKILKIDPESAEAHNNVGVILKQQRKYNEAIPFFRNALNFRPDYPLAYNNLGTVLHETNRLSEAESSLKAALILDETYMNAHYNLANVFQNQGRIREAIAEYRAVLKTVPDHLPAYQNLLFSMYYDETIDNEELFSETRAWWVLLSNSIAGHFEHSRISETFRRLRIGYVSPDFCQHSVSHFFLPLLAAHNRINYEIYCYAEVKHPDTVTERIRKMCDVWRSTLDLTNEEMAQRIYSDNIDILVDLAGHTCGNRLPVFALKPAPIQISWLGFPGTTGMAAMDYRLTDNIADPEGQADRLHAETLIRLPKGFLCYSPPGDAPEVGKLPALANGRITFGSFNNRAKINERVISVWARILHQVKNSSLLMKGKALKDQSTKNEYFQLFLKYGIPTERITMMSHVPSISEHLALYNKVDIGLDTFPYNGTTTTCEALWMGVPVITLLGNRHSGRVGASILTRIGLAELILENEQKYVSKAVELALDLKKLYTLRNEMRNSMEMSSLCDAKSFAGDMEATYGQLWKKWRTVPETAKPGQIC